MYQHLYFVNILCKLVSRPFLFTVLCCKVELVDKVAVIGSILLIDYRIITVDPY
jgi:hypothetical protein